jgi:signal peptidase I
MRREIFEGSETEEVWVEGQSQDRDSKVLLTISNHNGERTVLITPEEVVESKSKLFVQAPPERISTPKQLRTQKRQTILRNTGYVFSAIMLTFSALSVTGFVKARIVLTASMEPAISPGDIVLLANPKNVEPKVGSIVAYTGRRFSGESVGTFTHRIIDGTFDSGFTVKGDNNPSPDVQKPGRNDVTGVVFLIIPFIGKLLTPKALIILIPCLVGLWLILDTLRNEN